MSDKKESKKRYLMTVDKRLADKLGYIGEGLLVPIFLNNVLHILWGNRPLRLYHIYYCGSPDARLKDKFGLVTKRNAYE